MGTTGTKRLPLFTRVAAYQSADAKDELDAVAEGPEPRLVEVKWRNVPMSRADIAAFAAKPRIMAGLIPSERTPARRIISGSGFKP